MVGSDYHCTLITRFKEYFICSLGFVTRKFIERPQMTPQLLPSLINGDIIEI